MKQLIKNFALILVVVAIVPIPASANLLTLAAMALILSFAATIYPATPVVGTLNGVQVEIWVRYIINKFWKQNAFLKHAFNDDQYVVGGKIVHIPQPGTNPTVVKNRNTFPAAAVQRADTDITFPLDVYTTDPTHIIDADKVELSYDKMDSVLGDHTNSLNQLVADDILIKWLTGIAAGNIIRTSGANANVTATGQTGQRKVFVHGDLRKAALAMNLQDLPDTERYTLLEANMADQLFESLSNTQYRDFSSYADAATGVIGKLYGFNIMTRSSIAMATSADAINPLGAAVAATDNVVSLCWHKNSVTRAMGEVKVFDNPNRAEYYGDILSALLRAGARRRREDNKGVIAIVQAPAA